MREITERMTTGIYTSEDAQVGYALNKMCYSFNKAENRAAFVADPDGYCDKYGLNKDQRAAVMSRDKRDLLAAGASLYFITKLLRVPPLSENKH